MGLLFMHLLGQNASVTSGFTTYRHFNAHGLISAGHKSVTTNKKKKKVKMPKRLSSLKNQN